MKETELIIRQIWQGEEGSHKTCADGWFKRMSGLIGNGVTWIKRNVKKNKELEGTGELLSVRQ